MAQPAQGDKVPQPRQVGKVAVVAAVDFLICNGLFFCRQVQEEEEEAVPRAAPAGELREAEGDPAAAAAAAAGTSPWRRRRRTSP